MGILRADRVSGLGGANAITGSTFFGNSSADSNNGNTGDYLRIETNTTDDFAFGTGDFTIEFWLNRVLSTHQQHFYDFRGNTNTNTLLLYMSNNVMYYFGNGGERITSGTVPSGVWVHVALVRSSGSTKLYFDGTQQGSTYSDSINFVTPPQGSGYIGSNGGTTGILPTASFLSAHISNFRVQKGKAEYTSAFTPPTHRLEKTPETVLLTCNSSGDVSNEETGKVVTPSSLNSNSKGPQASRFTPNSPVGFSTTSDVGTQFGSTFDGVTTFDSQAYMVPPGGNTRERNRGRGLFAGGDAPIGNVISSIEIQSQGNAVDFGDMTQGRLGTGSVGSSTRGLISSGYAQPANANVATIDFVTIANTSNATTFGDSTQDRHELGASSSETRAIFGGGTSPSLVDTIDFVTIATAGDASDFGNLTVSRRNVTGVSSPTRSVFLGGRTSGDTASDVLDFVTIASTGNATDFGNLTVARGRGASVCSSTRGIMCGGETPSIVNTIDFFTIATTGNATDFGDCITLVSQGAGGASNKTRGAFCVGYIAPAYTNAIQFVTIATTGNSVDFGDNTVAGGRLYGFSDSHGGLS